MAVLINSGTNWIFCSAVNNEQVSPFLNVDTMDPVLLNPQRIDFTELYEMENELVKLAIDSLFEYLPVIKVLISAEIVLYVPLILPVLVIVVVELLMTLLMSNGKIES